MNAATKTILLCLVTCMAGIGSAGISEVSTGAGSDSLGLETRRLPVLGIYDLQLNAVVPGVNPRLTIVVWEDGLVVFSEALQTGKRYWDPAPLRQGRCDPSQIEGCFETLEKCGVFELERTHYSGFESSGITIHAISTRQSQVLVSSHGYERGHKHPDEKFKRAWDCGREAILQLVPKESQPLDYTPSDVLEPWRGIISQVASVTKSHRKATKALKAYLGSHGVPPPSLEDLVPHSVDKLPEPGWGGTRDYIPEVEAADGGTKECQLQIHYPRRHPDGFKNEVEWAVYRPSERYPAEFQGHKTYVYGGWAFTLYDEPSD